MNDADFADMAQQSAAVVDEISPLFAGVDSAVQAAVLADLTSMLLAGHVVVDDDGKIDRGATDYIREGLIAEHLNAVRALIVINEAMIHGDALP